MTSKYVRHISASAHDFSRGRFRRRKTSLRTWLEKKGFRVFELLKMQASVITHHPDRAGAGFEITALVFSVIGWCLLSSQTVSAQERCRVKLSDLPQATELKGFRLGMTMDQVRARVRKCSLPRQMHSEFQRQASVLISIRGSRNRTFRM